MSDEIAVVDPRGDVKLRVGKKESKGGQVIFQVCSRALARSSNVLNTMLYGKFLESQSNASTNGEEWTIDLPEHGSNGMRIYLNIIHANFKEVPTILSIDDLYELTALTNYYDSSSLLTCWVDKWMSSIEGVTKDADQLMPKLLWISWELGYKEIFISTCNRMLMESPGLRGDDDAFDNLHIPADILEQIRSVRMHAAKALLDVFNDIVEDLLIVDEKPRWCHHASYMGPHRCESMILGSITFCLARARLWPIPEPQDLEYSLLGLYRKLTGLVIHDIGKIGENPGADHGECNPLSYLSGRMKQIMEDIPSPVTEVHMAHLRNQAAKIFRK